jgi:prepilin-type N-terminal cleavage/methylation domain-containing protein
MEWHVQPQADARVERHRSQSVKRSRSFTAPASRSSHPPASRATASFTLIELLVVVAIISLLAALLLPALGRAKEQGKRAACVNNLRQIGTAIFLSADDHNGEMYLRTKLNYPFGWSYPTCTGDYGGAGYQETFFYWKPILRYLGGNTRVFFCPSAKPSPGSEVGRNSYFARVWTRGYQINTCAYEESQSPAPTVSPAPWPVASYRLADVAPTTPLVIEWTLGLPGDIALGLSWLRPPAGNHGTLANPQALHLLWADGSVSAETKRFVTLSGYWVPNGPR